MTQPIFSFAKSEQAAERGMAAAAAIDQSIWAEQADCWLLTMPAGLQFTADYIVKGVGFLPGAGPNKNNAVGAWFSTQAKKGNIRWTGRMAKSSRVRRHTGLQRVWVKL